MNITLVKILLVGALLTIGFVLIFRETLWKQSIKKKVDLKGLKENFYLTNISAKTRYVRIRNLVIFFLILYSMYRMVFSLSMGIFCLCLTLLIYMVSSPVDYFGKHKSVYYLGKSILRKRRQAVLKQELTGITIQLKNLLLSLGDSTYSGKYILERLITYTNKTKPYFTDFLLLYVAGKGEEGVKLFEESFGFKQAADFVHIIMKIDEIPAKDLLLQVDILLTSFWEERDTYQEKKTATQANLLFTLSSVEVMALIFDFVIVVLMSSLLSLSAI